MEAHGKSIRFFGGQPAIAGMPRRADLVAADETGRRAAAKVDEAIRGGKPVLVKLTDVAEALEFHYGVQASVLHLFGATPDGAKALVVVEDLPLYFDILVEAETPGIDQLRMAFAAKELSPTKFEERRALPLFGFREEPADWYRLHFPTVAARRKALAYAGSALGCQTASDDSGNIFRLLARDHRLPITDWAILMAYSYLPGGAHPDEAPPAGGSAEERAAAAAAGCARVFRATFGGIRPLVDPMADLEVQARQMDLRSGNPLLARPRTLVMGWDIETYSGRGTGDVPLPQYAEDRIFMACCSFFWEGEAAPLFSVCLVDVEADPDPGWLTVVCGSERVLLQAFAAVFAHFSPDIVAGFNDGGYDWPFVIERARQYGDLGFLTNAMAAVPRRNQTEEGAARWNVVQDRGVKVSAESRAFVSHLRVAGVVPVDVRICFMKLFAKAEVGKVSSSLKFYLKKCNIDPKEDMPILRMWQIYRDKDAAGMRDVARYCVVDAQRCQQLLERRRVIGDARAYAARSYTSLYDAVFNAGGHKVCNMLFAYAAASGLDCSSKRGDHPDGKYSGAFVFPPQKGLSPDPTEPSLVELEAARAGLRRALGCDTPEDPPAALEAAEIARRRAACAADPARAAALEAADARVRAALAALKIERPITGLDFSSLYPSIIMAYNLSPEKFVATRERADHLRARGHSLHHVQFDYCGRPLEGWFVRHDNDPAKYGIFPRILQMLFNQRKAMKKTMERYKFALEQISLARGNAAKELERARAQAGSGAAREGAARTLTARVCDGLRAALGPGGFAASGKLGAEEVRAYAERVLAAAAEGGDAAAEAEAARIGADYTFRRDAHDSEQKALKVYMNTFYGEAGNKLSPIYLLLLAGGVTSAGKYNIQLVADFVRRLGYRIKYGDTDSVYLQAADEVFAAADADYAFGRIGREAYWTEMVAITMRELAAARDKVNAELRADNGTGHLRMAYEEVLYPAAYVGKKKYFGIPHENVPNFRIKPKDLFVRGIDVVKMGQTNLARAIGHRVMWAACALDNDRSLLQITEDVVADAVQDAGQWDFEDFVQTDAYKPDKKNVSVQTFVARMRVRAEEEKAANDHRRARGEEALPTLYSLPEPGERFRYVLIKPASAFDLTGRKHSPKKGQIMEYADVARALGLEIDIGVYLKSAVIGLCARFVASDGAFGRAPAPEAPDAEHAAFDKASRDAANRYLTDLVEKLRGNADAATMRKRGHAYRRAWKTAVASRRDELLAGGHARLAQVLHGGDLEWSMFLPGEGSETQAAVVARARDIAAAAAELDAPLVAAAYPRAAWLAESPDRLHAALANFRPPKRRGPGGRTSLGFSVMSDLGRLEARARERVARAAARLGDFAVRYEASLETFIQRFRAAEHASHAELGELDRKSAIEAAAPAAPLRVTEEDAATAAELYEAWLELSGAIWAQAMNRAAVAALEREKALRLAPRSGLPPSPAEMRAILASGAGRARG